MASSLMSITRNIFECVSGTCSKVWLEHKGVVISLVIVVSSYQVYKSVKNSSRRKRWNAMEKDVVLVHCTAIGRTCPNFSPFVMKLETYMRMSGIKYELDTEVPFGPKGQFPWITFNGKDYADSTLIIEFLGKKFGKNFSSHLNSEQLAISRTIQIMMEDHAFWGLILWRFILDLPHFLANTQMPFFVKFLPFSRNLRRRLKCVPIGRHSDEELTEMVRKDLEALSNILNKKDYFMGSQPCEVDCAVFGMLAQFYWTIPSSPLARMVTSDFKNLSEFCIRMKQRFWPDWNERLLK